MRKGLRHCWFYCACFVFFAFSGRSVLYFDVGMPRRSARIRVREAAVSADDFPLQSTEDSESDGPWCSSGGCDDGRLMLYCDQQREGCFV